MLNATTSRALRSLVFLVLPAALGCTEEATEAKEPRDISVSFAAKVGSEPFSCTASYANLGMNKTTAEPLDLRMYLHDVHLIRADDTEVPLELEQDETWQRDDLALLDFEDGTGTCQTGSPETRTKIVGKVAAGNYVGIGFTLGVPAEQNHLDAATAPAPLNIPGMWWSWKGGYKFMRLEMKTPVNPTYFFHLGSTACNGDVNDGFTCATSNQTEIHLDGFDPDKNTVVFDVASLFANADLDNQIDPMNDGVSGCMSFPGDPECPAIFGALGMTFEGQPSGNVTQTAFRME